MAVVTIDSYSESNRAQDLVCYYSTSTSQRTRVSQSFTCSDGITLDSAKLYLFRQGSSGSNKPTYVKIYSHSGTYGTSSLPGSLLATSDAINTDSIGTSQALVTYSFSGTNRISLASSTYYVLVFDYTSAENPPEGTSYDNVWMAYDYTSPTHSGNRGDNYNSGTMSAIAGGDLIFYVYGDTVAPTVTTQACSSVTHKTATANGNITATGGAAVTRRGFCYKTGTSGDPTTSDSTAYDDGTFGTGAYTKGLTGLSAATGYRVRAYAVNSVGTSYGTTVQLTTAGADAPVVSTTTTTLLNRTVATVGGNVTDQGSESVTERGIYYGTSQESLPTKVANGLGTGTFPVFITGLTAGTTYFFKAFATSSIGTSYGDVLSFTTGNSLAVNDKTALPPFNRA